MPEAACGGVKNVLAVCNQDTQISKAAQQRDSLLLRLKTEEEAGSYAIACQCCHPLLSASCRASARAWHCDTGMLWWHRNLPVGASLGRSEHKHIQYEYCAEHCMLRFDNMQVQRR